jgi:hypothetical protein
VSRRTDSTKEKDKITYSGLTLKTHLSALYFILFFIFLFSPRSSTFQHVWQWMGREMGLKTRDLVEGLDMGLCYLVPILHLTTVGFLHGKLA